MVALNKNFTSITPLNSYLGARRIGPSTRSRITHIPGIFEKMNHFEGLSLSSNSRNFFPSLIPESQLLDFVNQTGIGQNMVASPFSNGQLGFGLSSSSWRKFWGNFKERKLLVEFLTIVQVPIAEIHCPVIKGCKATYIQETKETNDNYLNVQIFGFGGGCGKSISIGTGYEIPAIGDCRQILVPIELKIRQEELSSGEKHTSAEVVKIKNGITVEKIDKKKKEHLCNLDFENINKDKYEKNWEQFSFERGPVPNKIRKSIDIGSQSDFGLDLEIKEISTKIVIKTSIQVIKQIKFEYELVGGYNYIRYPQTPNSSIFCWAWKNHNV